MKKIWFSRLFWWIGMPCLIISAILCYIEKLNFMETPLFIFSLLLMLPLIMLKSYELQDSAIENYAQDFREMGATEFLNFMDEFKKIPLGQYRAIIKEAYRQEYLRRYNKDIFNAIPLFGEV